MNVRTALISSALLLAVLGWACEQGPTSPSALGAPGGGSLGAAGGVSLDAAGGAILGANPPCVPLDPRPQCKPKGDGGDDGGGGAIFLSTGSEGVLGNATCAGGALETGTTFGTVNWSQLTCPSQAHS